MRRFEIGLKWVRVSVRRCDGMHEMLDAGHVCISDTIRVQSS